MFGNDKRYTIPLLQNSKNITNLYPGWIMNVFHDKTVNKSYLSLLKKQGVITIDIEDSTSYNLPPKMWRFLPINNNNNDIVIFRDADSLLTIRERELVMEWVESDKLVHIIRDHPLHVAPILAGMFGMKKQSFNILGHLMKTIPTNIKQRPHDYDQVFLADYFYPLIRNIALINVSFFKYRGECITQIAPVKDGYNYIGAVFNDTEMKREKEKQILLESKFIIGIPFSLARLFRYRVRPIIYSSICLNFLNDLINNLKYQK